MQSVETKTFRFADERGEAELRLDGSVLLVRSARHISATHSERVLAHMHGWMNALPNVEVFVDFYGVKGYDTAARLGATAWCRKYRTRVESVHFLTKPGIVAMGVATAAMTLTILGLRVEAHRSPNAFREQHAMACARVAPTAAVASL
ncbi:MAG: hypothetical protein AAF938_01520 [Myxococcota bacterium]